MKKLIFSILMLVATLSLSAQSMTEVGKVMPLKQDRSGLVNPLNQFNDAIYYIENPLRYGNTTKKSYKDELLRVNPKSKEVTSLKLPVPASFRYLGAIETAKELVMFYCNDDSIYVNKGKKNEIGWFPEKVMACDITRADLVDYVLSADGTKLAIIASQTLENNYNGAKVYVFDNAGKPVWNGKWTVEDPTRGYQRLNTLLDKNGNVHTAVYSFRSKGKSKSDHQLRMYSLCPDSVAVAIEPIAFGNIEETALVESATPDVLVLAGYFAQKPKDNATANFSMSYNTKFSRIMFTSNQKFPGYYKTRKKTTPEDVIMNQEYKLHIIGVHTLSNNTIVVLADQQLEKDGVKYSGNIIYDEYSKDGEILRHKVFHKDQVMKVAKGMEDQPFETCGLSFGSFMQNDKIYVVFADNLGNYVEDPAKAPEKKIIQEDQDNPKEWKQYNGDDYKMGCTIVMSIDENLFTQRHVLNRSMITKNLFSGFLLKGDRFLLLYTRDGKNLTAQRLSFRFN
ncbi:MAG: hypothetical protein MJZ98_03835 [Paludibacteraceae bacterium]|nr:hypothetical protein [Paludibacteraceae bacterium]